MGCKFMACDSGDFKMWCRRFRCLKLLQPDLRNPRNIIFAKLGEWVDCMIFLCNSVFFHKIPMFFPKKNSYHSQCQRLDVFWCHQTWLAGNWDIKMIFPETSIDLGIFQPTFDDTRRHLASGYLTVRYGQCPINIDDLPFSWPKMVAFPALKPSTGLQNLSYRCPYIYIYITNYSHIPGISWENRAPAIHPSIPAIFSDHPFINHTARWTVDGHVVFRHLLGVEFDAIHLLRHLGESSVVRCDRWRWLTN